MRNWNSDVGCRHDRYRGLPDYLWGIETETAEQPLLPSRNRASRLPMRNWNSLKYCANFPISVASRLPMRNWNAVSSAEIGTIKPASRLPMRNWNSISSMYSLTLFLLPDYLWGIETTTAKRRYQTGVRASRLPMRNWNSFSSSIFLLLFDASRLPMRNWNWDR